MNPIDKLRKAQERVTSPRKIALEKPKEEPKHEKPKKKIGWRAQFATRDRLPAGSEFHVVWDGEKWEGNLMTTVGGCNATFHAVKTAVFKLLVKLDDMYREALMEVKE